MTVSKNVYYSKKEWFCNNYLRKNYNSDDIIKIFYKYSKIS